VLTLILVFVGSIVNVTSTLESTDDQLAGDVAIGGIRSLTTKVAAHCAQNKYGIRCNAIHMLYSSIPVPVDLSEAKRIDYIKSLKHMDESEAAELIVYLLSSQSSDNGGEINIRSEPVIINRLMDPAVYGLRQNEK
jgi:3(or 17)beta-hydroxysteroid dehydrogenase